MANTQVKSYNTGSKEFGEKAGFEVVSSAGVNSVSFFTHNFIDGILLAQLRHSSKTGRVNKGALEASCKQLLLKDPKLMEDCHQRGLRARELLSDRLSQRKK
jgi:hypothetical protein